ncbi:SDR family oxidoreductase [Bradyrhizobium sp. U87765 SZCCT0131]|uniref:SDR family oxidoreductase n=1 Tax=unclassified Bradyrhizobium TaxID=2631580 RepID=UPI001BAC9487|nr:MULTISPECIES: SDR family oxidoreductase [unclassified Bradyrhizobium]MBR1219355.1 SDR family oxidoreductase [Bradyrhizobium sp. U87765 SZCCT0131]MBR1262006.1 SDR family oxidoreductase [Bradyrhizobium sp. U87765 SZCCT0134]MBR1306141.1 SDR family oxidoreductase [Bradyrhizobium sp. U87765 SZCCT0110]MBR1317788.1 SDR family oxidoreductase [Bradyrhizobium sp. U87765 SZCCT0109]MBR1351490.1 SDR family oxidoreductase [Bradyrhizobium sp. U87765 SZCCT0048]
MRVFVTGAAGFIGSAVTTDLIAHGHQVIGLARSDENVATLEQLGAQVLRGSLQDLDSLQRGAREADGVIHLAFIHDFTKFAENGAIDRAAIAAMGDVLVGSNKPFIVTSGTGLVAAGVVITEDMRRDASPHVPRVSEQTGLAYASRGVRAMTIRLPQVHGAEGKAGLISYLVEIARQKGAAAYVGEGAERWAAAHRQDVARLYRLALEHGVADGIYHAVGEEGVSMRDVIEVVGRALNVPVRSIRKDEAGDYYGPLAMFAGLDMPASSSLTQQRLGWTPTGIGLIADIGQPGYFKA